MSQSDEDPALKELVTEALEKTGVLAAVRAHLRAGVFMALEREHEQHTPGPVHQLLATHDGLLALMLVQDLLEFCHLRHTASVYRAETGQPATFTCQGRDAIINNFKLDKISKNRNLPLLVQIISVLFSMLKTSPTILKSNSETNVKETQINNSDNYDTTFTSYSGSPTTLEENSKMSIHSVPDNVDDNKSSEDDKLNNSEPLNDTKIVIQTDDSEKSITDNDISLNSRDSENISHPESALSNSSVMTKDAMELISESMSSQNDSNQSESNEASNKTELIPNKNGINDYMKEHSQSCTSKNPSQCSNRTDLSNESIMEEIIPFEDNETSIISKLRASSDYSHTFSIDEALSMNSSKISKESSTDCTIPETPLVKQKTEKKPNRSKKLSKSKDSVSDIDEGDYIESESYKNENSSDSFQLHESSVKSNVKDLIPKNLNDSKKKLLHSQSNGLDQNT